MSRVPLVALLGILASACSDDPSLPSPLDDRVQGVEWVDPGEK